MKQLKLKLDDIEQEGRADSLLLNDVKQIPLHSERDATNCVLFVKMALTNIKYSDMVSAQ